MRYDLLTKDQRALASHLIDNNHHDGEAMANVYTAFLKLEDECADLQRFLASANREQDFLRNKLDVLNKIHDRLCGQVKNAMYQLGG